jgi:hypothetical protein
LPGLRPSRAMLCTENLHPAASQAPALGAAPRSQDAVVWRHCLQEAQAQWAANASLPAWVGDSEFFWITQSYTVGRARLPRLSAAPGAAPTPLWQACCCCCCLSEGLGSRWVLHRAISNDNTCALAACLVFST